ncbi:hypothetical protein QBC37DRAFT_172450 [Rhypophila decipiens]|uniref:Uncharacterized protein n=1 Tax=Rhypophila decipiens TaxID=261697 RepID=A0AAN6Y6I4_9PEZI|nr:hypothetical protein QBC37DRAFT_172450 [Rhypophila decipiens]
MSTALLDPFFAILTTTPLKHRVPLSALSDRSQIDTVVEGINHQHGIIVAQVLSATSRVYAYNESRLTVIEKHGVFYRIGKGGLNSTFPANVTDPSKEEHRVFQDEKATRIVQALLAGTLFFSLLSWGLSPKLNVLPRPPTSPASVLAMLVDGNLYTERFGPNNKTVVEMTRAEIDQTFANKPAFWMGWGRTGSDFPRKGRKGTLKDNTGDGQGQQPHPEP